MKFRIGMLIAIAMLVGCDGDDDDTAVVPTWTADLEGLEGREISGEAEVQEVVGGDGFTATAEIVGDEPGAVRPWHVHFGDCASGGGIVGEDGDYPRLMVGDDGTATATVTISEELDAQAPYHVNVHQSNEDLGTIIACGDLMLLEELERDDGLGDAGGAQDARY